MKKFIAIAVLTLGMVIAANAQPRAIGGRLGWGLEASYQHSVGQNFIEASAGLWGFNYFDVSANYNFMIAQPAWTSKGTWGFYAGPGVALDISNVMIASIQGMCGLEYTFWFPLQLSVDVRPRIGFWFGGGGGGFFASDLSYGLVPTLAARYRF